MTPTADLLLEKTCKKAPGLKYQTQHHSNTDIKLQQAQVQNINQENYVITNPAK